MLEYALASIFVEVLAVLLCCMFEASGYRAFASLSRARSLKAILLGMFRQCYPRVERSQEL